MTTNIPKNKKGLFEWFTFVIAMIAFLFFLNDRIYIERASLGVNFDINHNDNKTIVEPKICNYGKAPAEKISFTIYAIPLEEKFKDQGRVIFKDNIENKLYPGTCFLFGNQFFPDEMNGKNIALFFELSYADPLTKYSKHYQENIMSYKYTIGSDKVYYLLKGEQETIKNNFQKLKSSIK